MHKQAIQLCMDVLDDLTRTGLLVRQDCEGLFSCSGPYISCKESLAFTRKSHLRSEASAHVEDVLGGPAGLVGFLDFQQQPCAYVRYISFAIIQ